MALITLQNIGKIYVSDSNVAVGIRGVNLSFDKGEFVAVTGESGSGKSTLLNVISGMDTYEEGEMLVDGEPTSHYLQQDWEEYRREYISFIFQDYNIIESFTVLQNVELALMHIENTRERRERALELLRRVGLEKHLNHKGSKLSGGQKQRTVIARALAKDSPIILADEPTGNLDSKTSKEIIRLLREVSADKLVIVVTHSFEQVEEYATRHIRVYDGAIEADRVISASPLPPDSTNNSGRDKSCPMPEKLNKRLKTIFVNGLTLGCVRFRSTPKLSAFICILVILSALAMTFITSLSGDALGLFDKNYIFNHMDGRVVIVRRDGTIITDDELKTLSDSVGADSYMHYDFLLDAKEEICIDYNSYEFKFYYDNFDGLDAGRKPVNNSEVVLRVPISLKPYFGSSEFEETTLTDVFNIVDYQVVGVDYFYDNTRNPEIVFTSDGYITASALAFMANSLNNFNVTVAIADNWSLAPNWQKTYAGRNMRVSFDIGDGCYYINDKEYFNALREFNNTDKNGGAYTVSTTITGRFVNYHYSNDIYNDYTYYEDRHYESAGYVAKPAYGSTGEASSNLDGYTSLSTVPDGIINQMDYSGYTVMLSPDVVADFLSEHYYSKAYTQASLFFANDAQAQAKTEDLKALGYIAVASNAVNEGSGIEIIINTMQLLFKAFVWVISVIFITMFIGLCSTRSMLATKGDNAILRSMGISAPVIKFSIYIQTLISLIPAYLVTAIAAIVVFITPQTNAIFGFLHAWEYIVIAIALFVICLLLSKRYVGKMFGSSVKKTLKGDAGV